MKIRIKSPKSTFTTTRRYMERIKSLFGEGKFDEYGRWGIEALKFYTPKESETTANAWTYRIEYGFGYTKLIWDNENRTPTGVSVAVLIQYGHATKNGKFVEGIDFINPAMESVFHAIAEDMWKEVHKA